MKRLTTTSLMLGLLAGGAFTVSAQSPKVVVGIVVDQLRTDYLEQLQPYFGNNGFKRLFKEGVYIPDVDFKGTVSDAPTGAAVIYTGAWPGTNGVSGARTIDHTLKRNIPVLAADDKGSRIDFTPEKIRYSTIADELFVNNGTLTKIYSVGADPQVAVVTAGHAGTAAVWLDDNNGRWATSTYYGTLPPALANKNRTAPLGSRISSLPWRPSFPASYFGMEKVWNDADFNYVFSSSGANSYSRFKESAPFNKEVTDAAIDLLKTLQAGNSGATGMVNVEYSVAPVSYDYDGDNRPELFDSYIRLDAELGRLLDQLDREYGAGNALVFLSSTGYASEPEIPDTQAKIPTGEITLKKIESLLNSYLSAAYGNADYVALINGGKVYLDRSAAERKGIELSKLRAESKNFLLKMGGVCGAFTIDEIYNAENSRLHNLSLGIDPKNAPDITLNFTPGWTVTDDNAYPPVSEKVRLASPSTPAFIIAPGLLPETIDYTVEATAIAPTVSSLLRIRSPNGAAAKPLILKK